MSNSGRLEILIDECVLDGVIDPQNAPMWASVQSKIGHTALYEVPNLFALETWRKVDPTTPPTISIEHATLKDVEVTAVSMGQFDNLTQARAKLEELTEESAVTSQNLIENSSDVIAAATQATLSILTDELEKAGVSPEKTQTIVTAIDQRTKLYDDEGKASLFSHKVESQHAERVDTALFELFTEPAIPEIIDQLIAEYEVCLQPPYTVIPTSDDIHALREPRTQLNIAATLAGLLQNSNGSVSPEARKAAEAIVGRHSLA